MHSLDPVLMLEHHSLYGEPGDLPVQGGALDLDYCIPFGRARIARPGIDMTVAVYSSMVGRVTRVADRLAEEAIEIEVIDLRSLDLASIDYETLGESVARTGVFATVEQAAGGQSIGARIAAAVTERFFDELDAPPGVLTAMDVPNPVSRALEAAAMLDDEQIEGTLRDMALRRWR